MTPQLDDLDDRPAGRRAFDILLCICMLAALSMFYFGMTLAVASNWPTTKAKIESSVAEDAEKSQDKELFRLHVKVLYNYTVDGKMYRTEEIAAPLVTVQESKKYLAQYPVGSIHEIHYNPNAPQESQLASVSKNAAFFIWWARGLTALFGLGVILRFKMTRKNDAVTRR